MGVIKTGDIYKGFTFDGVDSKQYGTYITGEAVYNAPERDVEMIDIPGRNGSFVLDKGRFNNIIVTYPAGMFGGTQTDFADGISALRNALASRKGYCRLTDDYNPNEYRMAVYKSGMELTPSAMSKGGQFDIVFDCKPQRFLTSGETAVSVSNNGSVTNPTLFPSSPILQVWGYGQFSVGGQTMKINSTSIGLITVGEENTINKTSPSTNYTSTISTQYANSGNTITTSAHLNAFFSKSGFSFNDISVSNSGNGSAGFGVPTGGFVGFIDTGDVSFSYGTSRTETNTATYTFDTSDGTKTGTLTFNLAYNGSNTFTLSFTASFSTGFTNQSQSSSMTIYETTLNSTQSALGQPIYIDCEIGEAYKITNDNLVSVNNAVELPAELPTLKPGSNTVTYPNTITQFKIVPRWWKI